MKKYFLPLYLILCLIAFTVGYCTTTTTTNLSLVKPALEDETVDWYDTVNDNMDLIDAAFGDPLAYNSNSVISDLSDVDITDIANEKILKYNSTSGNWECEDDSGAGGAVDTSGTPVQYDYARFTDADTIEGRSYSEMKADLDLEIGTDIQAYDATLLSIAALGTAADKIAYTTGIDTWAETALTAFGRSILDDADEATFKATVNLETGTDVQAYDAQLADIAALAVTDGNIIVGDGTNWVAESGATARTSLGIDLSLYYLKTDINTQSKMETIWGVTLATDTELAGYQPLDTALTNISALTYVSPSYIKLTANDTYAVRTLAEVKTDLAYQLSDLSDVNTSTVTNRYVLVADGIDFESRLLVEADISDLGTTTAMVADKLSAFAPTTSAELAGVISDEIGSGKLVFDTSPTIASPTITGELGGEMDAGAHSIGFTQQTITYNATTTTVDWTAGNKATVTLTGNVGTFAFTNPSNPCNVLLKIVQDATGSRVVTAWDIDIKWANGGTAPTLSTAANAIDIVSAYFDGQYYYAMASFDFQ